MSKMILLLLSSFFAFSTVTVSSVFRGGQQQQLVLTQTYKYQNEAYRQESIICVKACKNDNTCRIKCREDCMAKDTEAVEVEKKAVAAAEKEQRDNKNRRPWAGLYENRCPEDGDCENGYLCCNEYFPKAAEIINWNKIEPNSEMVVGKQYLLNQQTQGQEKEMWVDYKPFPKIMLDRYQGVCVPQEKCPSDTKAKRGFCDRCTSGGGGGVVESVRTDDETKFPDNLLLVRKQSELGEYPEYKYQSQPGVKALLQKDPCRTDCSECASNYPLFNTPYVDLTDKELGEGEKSRVCLCNKEFLAATVPGDKSTPFPTKDEKVTLPYEYYMAGAIENDTFTLDVSRKFMFRCFNFIANTYNKMARDSVRAWDDLRELCHQEDRGISMDDAYVLFEQMQGFFDQDGELEAANFAKLKSVEKLGVREIHVLLWNVVYQSTGKQKFMATPFQNIAVKLQSDALLSEKEQQAGPFNKELVVDKLVIDQEWCKKTKQGPPGPNCNALNNKHELKHANNQEVNNLDSWVEWRFMKKVMEMSTKVDTQNPVVVTNETYSQMGAPLSRSEQENLRCGGQRCEDKAEAKTVNWRAKATAFPDVDCPPPGNLEYKDIGAQRGTQVCEGGFKRVASQLGGRIIEGPSGTTLAYLSFAGFFNFEPRELYLLRNAMLAFMIPLEDHSLLEILVSGQIYGVPFTVGSAMYSAEGLFHGASGTPECKALKEALQKIDGGKAGTSPQERCDRWCDTNVLEAFGKNAEPPLKTAAGKDFCSGTNEECGVSVTRHYLGQCYPHINEAAGVCDGKGSGLPQCRIFESKGVVELGTKANDDVKIETCGPKEFKEGSGWQEFQSCLYGAVSRLNGYTESEGADNLKSAQDNLATSAWSGLVSEAIKALVEAGNPIVYRVGGMTTASEGRIFRVNKFKSTSRKFEYFECRKTVDGAASQTRNVIFLKKEGSRCKTIPNNYAVYSGEAEVLCLPGFMGKVLHIQGEEDTTKWSSSSDGSCTKKMKTYVIQEV